MGQDLGVAVEFLRLGLGGVYHLCTKAQISHPEFEMFEGLRMIDWWSALELLDLGMDLDGNNAKMGMGDTGFVAMRWAVNVQFLDILFNK